VSSPTYGAICPPARSALEWHMPELTRKHIHDHPEWQAAIEALMLVVTHGGPAMFARIGMMRALNRDVVRTFESSRKEKHWGRRKQARDR
jgi:hypothetical protein